MNPPPHVVGILDDEPQMRKALRRLLSTHEQFRTECFEDGGELLTALDSHLIDCLVLDLHLPAPNGFDILTVLASRGIELPVIVITGRDEPGYRDRALSLGARAYLLKPVDESTLIEAIRDVT